MSTTKLDYLRSMHEECEECEKAIERELSDRAKSVKDLVLQEHMIKACMERASENSKKVLQLYADKDGSLKSESSEMENDMILSFYERLTDLKNYHQKFPDQYYQKPDHVIDPPTVIFSGEEFGGRYVDLNSSYEMFINLPKITKIDYITFLEEIRNSARIPRSIRLSNQYRQYLESILSYCCDYYHRIQPLVNIEEQQREFEDEFLNAWKARSLSDWQNFSPNLDWKRFSSSKDLESIGVATIRELLSSTGLKSGGTLDQVTERLWESRGRNIDTVNAADVFGLKKGCSVEEFYRPIAQLEVVTMRYLSLLDDRIRATIRFIEKKQILSYEEIMNEIIQAEQGDESLLTDDLDDDDEEKESFHNPLNLPIGWDGKPIPYWLWKLHGLGVEFKCEICGNHSYWGRRAFDLHFQEWRHALGMKCLGIPNTKHFHDITKIEEAESRMERGRREGEDGLFSRSLHDSVCSQSSIVYRSLKDQVKKEEFLADNEEEFEDSHGNVISKKMYNDLARQGLL